MQDAASRYSSALELYRTTDLSVKDICEQTGTPLSAFRTYLQRCHRELMFARYGITVSPEEAAQKRLRKPVGQTPAAHAKYKDAIMACDDAEYIEYNVSQIAHIFHLDPTGLGNQLRSHFPEILERREKARHRLGFADNLHRGARQWALDQYADAVNHLRTTDDTISHTADLFNISFSGLKQHLLFYHKDLVEDRSEKRKEAEGSKIPGGLTGNGQRYLPAEEQTEKYKEALHLYRTTAMTQKEIVAATGISHSGLRNYLRTWRPDLRLEHLGINPDDENAPDISEVKAYRKSTAEKYAPAIERLKATGASTSKIAKEFNLNPDVFRQYLHEHEPELAQSLGKTTLKSGKKVLARNVEKYEEAVRIFESTTENLKSIALRLGLQYNTIGGYVRRNHLDAIERHNALVKAEMSRRHETPAESGDKDPEEEKKRILNALDQSGNNRSRAAKLLGICKSTLYNRMHALNIRI